MASAVLLAPVPAITGTRLLTCFTVASITAKCSSTAKVALSPVVPTATMPSVPLSMCQSIRDLSCSK